MPHIDSQENVVSQPGIDIYFDDPRLGMTVAGRLLVRVVSWITYLVVIAAAFTLLISSVPQLRFSGVFLALFLADRLAHRGEADKPIRELPNQGRINVARVLQPAAFSVLERAFDVGLLTRHNFFLEVAKRLTEFPDIEEYLQRFDIKEKEFKERLDGFLTEHVVSGAAKTDYRTRVELLVLTAFREAVSAGHAFIGVSDLFSALVTIEDETTRRFFNLFSLGARGNVFPGERSDILKEHSRHEN